MEIWLRRQNTWGQTLSVKNKRIWGWRDGLLVNRTGCSFRRSDSESQHPRGGLWLYPSLFLGESNSLCGNQMCKWYTDKYAHTIKVKRNWEQGNKNNTRQRQEGSFIPGTTCRWLKKNVIQKTWNYVKSQGDSCYDIHAGDNNQLIHSSEPLKCT